MRDEWSRVESAADRAWTQLMHVPFESTNLTTCNEKTADIRKRAREVVDEYLEGSHLTVSSFAGKREAREKDRERRRYVSPCTSVVLVELYSPLPLQIHCGR